MFSVFLLCFFFDLLYSELFDLVFILLKSMPFYLEGKSRLEKRCAFNKFLFVVNLFFFSILSL